MSGSRNETCGCADLMRRIMTPDFYQYAFTTLSGGIPAARAALFYFYDGGKTSLNLEHAFGFERNLRGMPLSPALEGICGKVFASGRSEVISDAPHLKRFTKEMKPLTEVVRFDDGGCYYEPSSLLVSPITVNSAPDGLIVIIGHSPHDAFSGGDIALAESVAAAVALHRTIARMNEDNSHLSEELRAMKEVVDSDDDVRRYSGAVSSALGAAFLRGQEFAEMLEIAHSYAAVPMALYNMFLEQIARTDDAAAMRLPENIVDFIQPGGFSKNGWMSLEHDGGTLFLIPIYYGGRARGILTVRYDSPAFSEKKRAVLNILSQYLASVWLKKAAVNEYNNNLKNEILTGILSGDGDSSLLPKLRTLGIEKKGQFFVILLMIPNTENHLSYCGTQDGATLLNTLESLISAAGLKGIVIPEYNDVCMILSCGEARAKTKRYANVVDELMASVTEAFPEFTVSGSRVYETIYNVRKCYWEASQCLRIINRYFIHRKSVNYLNMGALRLLLTQNKEDIEAYLEDILLPIVEYDRSRGTELLMTLFYYARFNKSVGYVSKKLSIHPNTLYQRVKKIEELLGYSLEDPMDWFDIQAASIMYGLIYTDLITNL
ncbi:helix-turn-helix domain-containing protein [uncultured Cloacibacillus sp.]|uniref:helix-turn-helix domain-containing protein n=1 Tax=uncultured Cloacibacillus sp. TaxID=889794 RepID=UPI00260B398E|nr:helix-turn-helix domain-containing protein [uncultured Cloacibacillus sp.]